MHHCQGQLTISLVSPVGLSDLVVQQGLDERRGSTAGRKGQLLHGPNGVVVVNSSGAIILQSDL